MNSDWIVPGALAVLVALALLVLLVTVRDRRRVAAELAATRVEAAELRAKVDALALQSAVTDRPPAEFVITDIDRADRVPATRIEGRLFADIVLRETVVKAAAAAAGVRRALSPEVRNRVRFEMKREVKRARKERKQELKQARRELHARQRARLGEDAA
ncbi:hypothetical protein [Nocardioides speluncae]|uniref:hypothetical protein n=1 Tax=Nocardioides speluncae TaxID=2670337 RepID=UPI0012B17311|nr:hypothetical protein [Nocardioides speluncae]